MVSYLYQKNIVKPHKLIDYGSEHIDSISKEFEFMQESNSFAFSKYRKSK